jgi:hypothetical protein
MKNNFLSYRDNNTNMIKNCIPGMFRKERLNMEISEEGLKLRNGLYLVLPDYEMRALECIASQEIRRPHEVARELIRQEAQRRRSLLKRRRRRPWPQGGCSQKEKARKIGAVPILRIQL